MSLYKKLFNILSSKQRYQFLFLVFCILICMLLETIGVGAIIPVLSFMTKKDIVSDFPQLKPFLTFLGNPSQQMLIVYSMGALVAFYFFKTFFVGFYVWRLNTFICDLLGSISYQLYSGYLKLPWTFHMQRNSAELILNTNTESGLLAFGVQAFLTFVGEGVILCGILFLLLMISPVETLIIASVLGSTVYVVNLYVKKRLVLWGKERLYHEKARLQQLQQGLRNIKDVKLLGREKEFSSQYDEHNTKVVGYAAKVTATTEINRLLLELFGLMALAILVIVLVIRSSSLDTLLPRVGLFAVAAFKLLPFVNRITNALYNMRYRLPSINKIFKELQIMKESSTTQNEERLSFNKVISLNNVSYRYDGKECNVLNSVTVDIFKGSSIGFIGSSGAGKSTLIDLILGLLTPSNGQILVDGVDIHNKLSGWQKQIGYVPQNIYLIDDTIRRNIALGVPEAEIDDAAVARALHLAQLEEFLKTLPEKENTVIGENGVRLSGGQRQRIGIARALYNDPEVLVLDEATSALDSITEYEVMREVNALHGSKTLIIIAHRLSSLSGCDRLYELESGSLVREGDFEHMTVDV